MAKMAAKNVCLDEQQTAGHSNGICWQHTRHSLSHSARLRTQMALPSETRDTWHSPRACCWRTNTHIDGKREGERNDHDGDSCPHGKRRQKSGRTKNAAACKFIALPKRQSKKFDGTGHGVSQRRPARMINNIHFVTVTTYGHWEPPPAGEKWMAQRRLGGTITQSKKAGDERTNTRMPPSCFRHQSIHTAAEVPSCPICIHGRWWIYIYAPTGSCRHGLDIAS